MVREKSVAGLPLAVSVLALMGLLSAPALAAPPLVFAQYFESLGDEPEDGDDPALDEPSLDDPSLDLPGLDGEMQGSEPLLRPDMKPGADEESPPQSAEETKENKLDLKLGDLPLLKPLDRPRMLADLYEKLSAARNAYTAEPIIKAIEELWAVSGSDTVDLLMDRAAQFANEAEVDLSLSILDAVVDIAPTEAEAWYLRAKVNVLKGKPERALADLRRALNLDDKHYRAIADLGLILEQLGAKKEALEAYRRALAVNPFLDDAKEGVEALKREVEGQDI
jgi:tetratricopeptide (TPR) repeat protein